MEEKGRNNNLVSNAIEFLKKNKDIQRYIFSSVQTIKHVDYVKCVLHEAVADYVPVIHLIGIASDSNLCMYIEDEDGYYRPWQPGDNIGSQRYKAVDRYTHAINMNSIVELDRKQDGIWLSRTKPDNPSEGKILCSPEGEDIASEPSYRCKNAIGVEYTKDRTGNATLIALGDGEDQVVGSVDQDNIFIAGKGNHEFYGGDKNDYFIFQVRDKDVIKATVNGFGGTNTIDVSRLNSSSRILVDFNKGIVSDDISSEVYITMRNINKFLGRKGNVDEVVTDCSTKYIDGRGGKDNISQHDRVTVLPNNVCLYEMDIKVNSNTIIQNYAVYGNFRYFVTNESKAKAYINLNTNAKSNNTVIFHNKLFDIVNIDRTNDSIRFNFIEEAYKKQLDDRPLDNKISLTVNGISGSNVKYFLADNAEIVVQERLLYALQNSDRSIDSLSMMDYSNVAKRLKMPIFARSGISNASVAVGSGGSYGVLQNDPDSKTHIVGNSGETVFVITCKPERVTYENLPLPEVVIHNFADDDKVSTLDLREIEEKLNNQEIDIEINRIGKDLLMQVFCVGQSKRPVVKIMLKDALKSNWYEKLRIITDSVLMTIKKVRDNFELLPLPLTYNVADQNVLVINPENVKKQHVIEVNRPIENYTFIRDNNNLLITNVFNSNLEVDDVFTMIFNDTYYGDNQDKIKTLNIKFSDQEIVLSREANRIENAENLKYLQKKLKINTYRTILSSSMIDSPARVNKISISQEQLNLELLKAISNKEFYRVKKLIDQGANINAQEKDFHGKKPIHRAAEVNQESIVKLLLNKGVNINDGDKYGWTALHYAANSGSVEVVKFLIEKGADVNRENVFGKKPIHRAAEHNHKNIIELFLSKGVDVNSPGDTPLRCAAWNGHIDTIMYLLDKGATINVGDIEYLLKKGVSINAVDNDGRTLLHWACIKSNLEAARFLISKGANINAKVTFDNTIGTKPIHIAAENNHKDVIELLLSKGAKVDEVDADGSTPLHWAAMKGSLEVAKFLINKGADVNAEDIYGTKPIHIAAENNHKDVIELLLSKGAKVDEVDADGSTPLHWAAMKGSLEVAKFLINKGADVNAEDIYGTKPIHIAAENNHKDVIELLLSKGAKVDEVDADGSTPLHWAAMKGSLEVAKFLINKGADVNAEGIYGRKPIHVVEIENNYKDMSELLFNKGVSINGVDNDGSTPLHWAAMKGSLEVAKFLINKGADVNAKNYYGENAIHIAAEQDHVDIIELLLSKGVNINEVDTNGSTPLYYAAITDSLEAAKFLIEKGANINAKDKYGITPLDIAKYMESKDVTKYLEEKLVQERGGRKRRHHHGDYARQHMSRKPLAIDSSNQPEIAASSGTRPSSWVNDLFGWVKSSVGGLLGSRAALPEKTFTQSLISQVSAPIDVNGTIMLLDLLIRKVTGQKYISTVDQSISPLEAQGYALNITEGFEKVVEQAGLKSGASMHRLNIDFVEIQKEVTGKIMSGKFDEISGVLNSYLEEACPGREAGCPGKLSPKKFDKFIAQFNKGLLNQSIEQILHNRDGTLEVDGAKQMSLEPQSYLSNASIQSHSKDKVSTCLSDIGVTKLGNTLSK